MSRSPGRLVLSPKGKPAVRRKPGSPGMLRADTEKILSVTPKAYLSRPTSPPSYSLSKVLFPSKVSPHSRKPSKKVLLRKSTGSVPDPESLILDFQKLSLKREIQTLQLMAAKYHRLKELEGELTSYRNLAGQLTARVDFYRELMGRVEENWWDEVGMVKTGVELRRSLGECGGQDGDLFAAIQKAADRLETWKSRTLL